MNAPAQVPKLSPRALSTYVADLVLVGAGESEAVLHDKTRHAWHWFFGSLAVFLVWDVFSRLVIIPSFDGDTAVYQAIRLIVTLPRFHEHQLKQP